MSITSEQITHIARLARLKVDPDQAEFYADQLSRILELVEQMNRIDADDITPMSHPQDVALRLRDDEVTAENLREQYQQIAPATEQGLYLVPRVIE
jgi:aspartyl-tRNA(Asn)/glutamyl-tRNA(Gln) amidotransferase subunit C